MEKQAFVYDVESARRCLRDETPLDTVSVRGRILVRRKRGVLDQDGFREFSTVRYWVCGHGVSASYLGFFTGSEHRFGRSKLGMS